MFSTIVCNNTYRVGPETVRGIKEHVLGKRWAFTYFPLSPFSSAIMINGKVSHDQYQTLVVQNDIL